ncbi:MAG: DUF4830 domain-containing protein [Oscillospiraceae bacterium]
MIGSVYIMFAMQFKLSPKKILASCCAVAVVLCGFYLLKNAVNNKALETAAITKETATKLPKVKINDDRLKAATILGWEVEREPIEIEEIIIPDAFDDVYEKYNEMQKESGFDLGKYKGKTCKRYAYKVNNCNKDNDAVMNIIVYKERIIGGDVSSRKLDGFMQGLLNEK